MNSGRNVYILCGGKSRRMGRDKAMIDLQGETLLEKQVRKAGNHFKEVILLSGPNSYRLELRQLPDAFENAGALSGLLAALRDGAENAMDDVAVISVDLPGLSQKTIEKLSEHMPAELEEAVLLRSAETVQPLAAIYKTALAAKLENYLKTGNRKVFGFAGSLNYSTIEVEDGELANLNRPADLDEF